MKIHVTGCAGFIGFHTAQRLLARGDEVVGLDIVNDYYDVRLKHARLAQFEGKPGFRFVKLDLADRDGMARSEEHTSELQSLMRISYAVFCLKKKKQNITLIKYPPCTPHTTKYATTISHT